MMKASSIAAAAYFAAAIAANAQTAPAATNTIAATISSFRTPTSTPVIQLPLDSGPTLTPWPTNTLTK
jgi:hypothetical protein